MTITDVIKKNPDRKYDLGCEWRHARKLRILVIFKKKAVSWDSNLGESSWFLDLGEASPVIDYGMPARCWVRWNSQHSRNCVSLSSYWKPKSQEGNKSFVPELKKVVIVSRDSYSSSSSSSCRAGSTDIPDPLSPLLPIVHRSYSYERFTYPYISHIRIMDILQYYSVTKCYLNHKIKVWRE